MADQAAFEQSLGDWSVMRYSEDGESTMDRGHVEEQPKGGGVSHPSSRRQGHASDQLKGGGVLDPSSRKHIVHAMPCVVNAGNITEVSDDEGNFDMTHARVEYVPSDNEDDVEITRVFLASGVERGRQQTTRGQAKRSTSRRSGSSRREASTHSGEGTAKVVKNIDKNRTKESIRMTATTKKAKQSGIEDAAMNQEAEPKGSVMRGGVSDSTSRTQRDTKSKRESSRARSQKEENEYNRERTPPDRD